MGTIDVCEVSWNGNEMNEVHFSLERVGGLAQRGEKQGKLEGLPHLLKFCFRDVVLVL
jgi:hypothetical protein